MGRRGKRASPSKTREMYLSFFWRHPIITLMFITLVEISLYFDRGAIASVQENAQKSWQLSGTEQGAIASIFTIGFMCASPLWAHFGTRYRINKVISVGLIIFSMAAVGCGIFSSFWRGSKNKNGYYYFTVMRFFIGIGESAMISLGYTIVNDLSPAAYKTIFMGVILVAAPVGVASGYAVTGAIISFTSWWGIIFFIEALFVTLAAILCWFVPFHGYDTGNVATEEPVATPSMSDDIVLKTNHEISEEDISFAGEKKEKAKEKPHSLFSAIIPLFTNPVYLCIVAYSNLNGAILGALTFWCPSYFKDRLSRFDMSEALKTTLANLGFAIIVLLASILGTGVGAVIVDKTGGVIGWRGISKALFISTAFVVLGIPWMYLAFFILSMHWVPLFLLAFIGIFFLMATTSPFQVALINAVHPNLRHYANSYQIFFLHAMGDLPSPTLFGLIKDHIGYMWAMISLWSLLIPGAAILLVGAFIALRNHKIQKPLY